MNKITEATHPILIFIRGLPGSGKTYLAHELENHIDNVVVLDPDSIDYGSKDYAMHVEKCKTDGVDEVLRPYRFLRGKAYQAIKDKKIAIWNQPFTSLEIFNKMVTNLRLQADENKTGLTILVVELEINDKVAKKRVTIRKNDGGHGPSDGTFDRFINDYKSFKDDGYNTVTIFGEDDVKESADRVISALDDLLQSEQSETKRSVSDH